MGEDILSVIFLALICILITAIVQRVAPKQMMLPTFVVVAVCLWIAYDYILLKRYKAKKACLESKYPNEELDDKIKQLTADLEKGQEEPDPIEEQEEVAPQAQHKNEFDIAMYDKNASTQSLFKDSGCSSDNKLANRMKYMGMQARMSSDIRARWNVEKFRPYFEEELRDNERRDWWDNDVEHLDLLM